jgi:predicted dehydrogenase
MIDVAIIGCGKIADEHAAQILRIPEARLVAVCDREPLMARQMAERFKVPNHFSETREMLARCRPGAVHITTPPQSHFDLARQCLAAKSSVYVEKPFTLNASEAYELIGIAESTGRKLTAGHNTQFTHVANEMRHLIRHGYLGGAPVHIESTYCYNFGDERYAKALLGDSDHWVRALPGGLLQNVISHGIGKIVEYLPGDEFELTAHAFMSPFLRRLREMEILDELRVVIRAHEGTTAYFTFSSQISPALHQFAIYGPKNSLIIDHHHQTLMRIAGKPWKSYLNQFLPPFTFAWQFVENGCRNLRRFARRELHADAGLHCLISSFYDCILGKSALPIPYRDILLTGRIMDDIFRQINEHERQPQEIHV